MANETRLTAIRKRAEHMARTMNDVLAVEDIPWLLDRLRAAEAELRVAEDQANNNAADAIAAEAKVTEIETALEASKVTSQNWFRNCMEARTERNSLKARAAEAEAVIAEVRDGWMDVDLGHVEFGRLVFKLLEAKPTVVLARVKDEAKAEALEEAAAEAGRAHALSLSPVAIASPNDPPEGAIYMPNAGPWLLARAATYRAGADHGQ